MLEGKVAIMDRSTNCEQNRNILLTLLARINSKRFVNAVVMYFAFENAGQCIVEISKHLVRIYCRKWSVLCRTFIDGTDSGTNCDVFVSSSISIFEENMDSVEVKRLPFECRRGLVRDVFRRVFVGWMAAGFQVRYRQS